MKYYSNSRENQDLFVLCVLDGKKYGSYLEIGAYLPIEDSNTYLLESEFGWDGISLEIVDLYASVFNEARVNLCVCADATTVDYSRLLLDILPDHIDYLQLDIDPHANTLKALHAIDFEKFSFSVITYEHDLYNGGSKERKESREILASLGYTLVVGDVSHGDLVFEDWYVNEEYMKSDNWRRFKGNSISMDSPSMLPEVRAVFENILNEI